MSAHFSVAVCVTDWLSDLQVRKAMAGHLYVHMLALQSSAEWDADTNAAAVQACKTDASVAAGGLQQLCAEDLEAGLFCCLVRGIGPWMKSVRAGKH